MFYSSQGDKNAHELHMRGVKQICFVGSKKCQKAVNLRFLTATFTFGYKWQQFQGQNSCYFKQIISWSMCLIACHYSGYTICISCLICALCVKLGKTVHFG